MRDFLVFLFLLLLVVALVAVGVAFYLIRFARAPILASEGLSPEDTVVFQVYEGETTADIARRLAEEGLIRSAWAFEVDARHVQRVDGQLRAGRYILRAGMKSREILETLAQGPEEEETTFTLLEGYRLEEVAENLERQGVVTAEEFFAAAEQSYDYDFLADRPEGSSLEGYLFPDTYRVPSDYSAFQVIDFVFQNFDQKLTPEMRAQAQEQGLSIYEVVTLASIVEREVIVPQERPIVASVYLNRLDLGMNLQACPTVQYALGYDEQSGRWWRELDFDALDVDALAEIDHPYNTYRYGGLPPGPICSPGLASLMAVLEPAETDYYYFVAKGDGSGEHAFARTLEEHNANIDRYQ
jgi:UPF0755 protein